MYLSSVNDSFYIMSGMQLRLQRELFAPNNETLLSLVHCISDKDKNKTKDIFLCLINETDYNHGGGLTHNIIEVKGQADLKRKRNWTLHELKSIDAKHSDDDANDQAQNDPGECGYRQPVGLQACLGVFFFKLHLSSLLTTLYVLSALV